MKNREISFVLNGKPITVSVDVRYSLADLLRNQLHLTGLKIGCAVGECGACT
ncbi:MAG: 2Fe-2S iron-sulfur cluster-binding protein, partial [Negativicutes bacterium]|nr:2Fe-2S iron-sulfur cluster-binding protein [Negativicutes bacterium]